MIYAIGDIHGMSSRLMELIEKLPLTQDDHLVFIGDYVDRGSDPKGVIEYLLRVQKRHRCTFLMGNHESMFLSFLGWEGDTYFGGKAFIENGGDVTLEAYGFGVENSFKFPPGHEAFFRSLELWYREGEYIFIHAGLPREVLSMSDFDMVCDTVSPRDFLWERATIELPHSLGVTIVYGHTPMPNFGIRWNLPYSIGIDTGCVYGGPLTAIRLPDETIFQV